MSKYQILKDYEQVLMDVEDVLGSGVTTNDQLDKLGYSIFKNDYLGTFSSDKMPKYIKNIVSTKNIYRKVKSFS